MTWPERIEAARLRGRFTEEDYNRSNEWSSCAVGELNHELGMRYKKHFMSDKGLENFRFFDDNQRKIIDLGCRFPEAIFAYNLIEATRIYNEIKSLSGLSDEQLIVDTVETIKSTVKEELVNV